MTVEVRDGFAAVRTVVDDQTVTRSIKPLLGGNLRRFEEQVAEQRLILRLRLGDAGDGLAWNDEDVDGRLRSDVAKREHLIVFIDDLRRDFARGNFFKQGFAHADVLPQFAKRPKKNHRINSAHSRSVVSLRSTLRRNIRIWSRKRSQRGLHRSAPSSCLTHGRRPEKRTNCGVDWT